MAYRIIHFLRAAWFYGSELAREAYRLITFPLFRKVPTCARCGEVVPPNPGNGAHRCGGRVINA